MPTCTTAQKFPIEIQVVSGAIEPGSITAASDDETVFRDEAGDDELHRWAIAVAPSQVDADGNPIPVRITYTADGDPGAGVQPILAVAEGLIATLAPEMTVIQVVVGDPVDK